MEKEKMEEIIQTTDFNDNDLVVDPNKEGEVEYRIRDLCEYAKSKGVALKDLTEEELEQFIIR